MRYRSLLEFQFGRIDSEVVGLLEPIIFLAGPPCIAHAGAATENTDAAPEAAAIIPPSLNS
jgi:hypothetical protein